MINKYKVNLIFVLCILLFLFSITSCKKNDERELVNNTAIIKYELISTSVLKVNPDLNYSLALDCTNSKGIFSPETLNPTGKIWSKVITITTSNRPLSVKFSAIGYTEDITGSVTLNLYVNDVLKVSNIVSITNYGNSIGKFVGAPELIHVLK